MIITTLSNEIQFQIKYYEIFFSTHCHSEVKWGPQIKPALILNSSLIYNYKKNFFYKNNL